MEPAARSRDAEAREESLCPTCRAPLALASKQCTECGVGPGGELEAAKVRPEAPARPGWFKAEPLPELPPRLTAQPPPAPPVTDAGAAVCVSCQAKNPWDARLCGRCGEALPVVAAP